MRKDVTLHASVSGTVADIYEDADSRTSVVIENDMKYENAPTLSSIGKKPNRMLDR